MPSTQQQNTIALANEDIRKAVSAMDDYIKQVAVHRPGLDAAEALRALRSARGSLSNAEMTLVRVTRDEHKATWPQIGEVLGISPRAAQQQYNGGVTL